MTNLAHAAAANQATSPGLPIDWFFDPKLAELERRVLFDGGPRYVGHELMVPELGDYQALGHLHNAKALVRNRNGVELIGNVCRHRQGILLQGRGNAERIVCPVHRWNYDLEGKLTSAPKFPCNPGLNLARTPLKSWNGLLFAGARDVAGDLANLSVARELDLANFVYERSDTVEYAFNWKTFLEPSLEVYHVAPYHPGLRNFVDADDLRWEFGAWHSVQVCGVKNELARPGSESYRQWHDAVLEYTGGVPEYGAIWFLYYPNVMVEWYPHALVISTVWPQAPNAPEKCINVVEFYYPRDIAENHRDMIAVHQASYQETAQEDAEICARIHAGRKALHAGGQDDGGPCQSPMEDGVAHFYEFLKRQLEAHLNVNLRAS